MWYVLGVIGGVLGAIWGWYDPSGFFGNFPPALSGSLGALGGALVSGWAFQKDAERADLPPFMLLVSGIFTALLVTVIMIGTGCSLTESSFGTYLAFMGGIAILVNPIGTLVGAAFGTIIWLVDWIEWTVRSEAPTPEAFVCIFSGGFTRFLSLVFIYSVIGAGVWKKSKK